MVSKDARLRLAPRVTKPYVLIDTYLLHIIDFELPVSHASCQLQAHLPYQDVSGDQLVISFQALFQESLQVLEQEMDQLLENGVAITKAKMTIAILKENDIFVAHFKRVLKYIELFCYTC